MKTIGLVINKNKDKDFAYAKKVIELLKANNFKLCLHSSISKADVLGVPVLNDDLFFETCDALLTLGGDGTLLRVAEKAAMFQKPILGINLGHLGYLAQLEKNDLDSLITTLLQSDTYESRSMLMISVKNNDNTVSSYYALNELMLGRKNFSNMLYASVYSNDEFVYEFKCDGVIFATPTGSTAYSMSAGGPIADSNLQDIIIFTPICEHSMFSKSMIFSSDDTLTCVVTKSPENSFIAVDGKTINSMKDVKEVIIQKSPYDLLLFKTSQNRFYKVLNNKFGDGGNK